MKNNLQTGTWLKMACAFALVAVVMAAGVAILVQHRQLDEQRRACRDLNTVNRHLVSQRSELVAANEQLTAAGRKMASELHELRGVALSRAKEAAACEKEIAGLQARVAACDRELGAMSNRLARAGAEVATARNAMKAALAAADRLKASVKALTEERDSLLRELNDVMTPAEENNGQTPMTSQGGASHAMAEPSQGSATTVPPAQSSTADSSVNPAPEHDTYIPVPPAPPPDNRTPEERAAHEKEELNDLMDL